MADEKLSSFGPAVAAEPDDQIVALRPNGSGGYDNKTVTPASLGGGGSPLLYFFDDIGLTPAVPFSASGNAALQFATIGSCNFSAYDFSGCPNLYYIALSYINNSAAVNASNSSNLITASISTNGDSAAALDFSNCPALTLIDCGNGHVSALGLDGSDAIQFIYIYIMSGSPALDLTSKVALEEFIVGGDGDEISEIKLPKGSSVFSDLEINSYVDTPIDPSDLPALVSCTVEYFVGATFDLSASTGLDNLTLYGDNDTAPLAALDLSANVSMSYSEIGNFPLLATFTLPAAPIWYVSIAVCPVLPAIDISMLADLTDAEVYNNDALAEMTTSPSQTSLTNFNCYGNAFTQPCVDAILANADAAGATDGYLNLSAGTAASPSATGLDSINNLLAKGWQVYTN